jgi:XRE family aerobic/anaerobic benzoate catabolism transcriptional regulator
MRDFGAGAAGRRGRIALLGLRGAGKSTLGPLLAAAEKQPFIELDREIEMDAGLSLSEVFSLYGEAGYRRIERRCLQKLVARHDPMVLAVGGGVVSDAASYELLLSSFVTVWVKAAPEEHMGRVIAQGDSRPMKGHAEAMADLKRILASREPLYAKADVVLETSNETPQKSVRRLRQMLRNVNPDS